MSCLVVVNSSKHKINIVKSSRLEKGVVCSHCNAVKTVYEEKSSFLHVGCLLKRNICALQGLDEKEKQIILL